MNLIRLFKEDKICKIELQKQPLFGFSTRFLKIGEILRGRSFKVWERNMYWSVITKIRFISCSNNATELRKTPSYVNFNYYFHNFVNRLHSHCIMTFAVI